MEDELSYYEYYSCTKQIGDALYYAFLCPEGTPRERDSWLQTQVNEIFVQSYRESSEAETVKDWYTRTLNEWKDLSSVRVPSCFSGSHNPARVCLNHFYALYPFLKYTEQVLKALRETHQRNHVNNRAYLEMVGATLREKFYASKYSLENIESFLIECETLQKGSAGVLISTFTETHPQSLFRQLLKSFKKMDIEKETSAPGRVLRSLEIRDERLQKRLKLLFNLN